MVNGSFNAEDKKEPHFTCHLDMYVLPRIEVYTSQASQVTEVYTSHQGVHPADQPGHQGKLNTLLTRLVFKMYTLATEARSARCTFCLSQHPWRCREQQGDDETCAFFDAVTARSSGHRWAWQRGKIGEQVGGGPPSAARFLHRRGPST